MKKRILSCLMVLALCLTLLPTAALAEEPEGTAQTSPAVEEAADPANGKAKQENQPAEQEEQQEDSATKQDEDVAAVQAMIDALPDATELDGMDDADAMAVYEAFQTACDAYYDTLTEGQQAQLKNTEKLAALSDWFSQSETLAEGEHQNHFLCGTTCSHAGEKHTVKAFTDATKLWMKDGTLMKGTKDWEHSEVSVYDKTETAYVLDSGVYYLGSNLKFTDCTTDYAIMINGDVKLCLNGYSITCANQSTNYVIAVYANTDSKLTLTDCKNTGKIEGGKSAGVELRRGYTLNMYGGSITGSSKGVNIDSSTFNMYGGTISGNSGYGVRIVSGTFKMSGGFISNNPGRGVLVGTGSAFNMSGGEITDNKGGGVEVYGYGNASLTVSGAAKIKDNTVNDKPNNVYLQQGKSFIAEKLTKDAWIGVTTEKAPTRSAPIKVAGVVEDFSNYIKSDQVGYTVEYINDSTFTGMVLAIQEHKHCLCGKADCDGRNGHLKQEINFIPWTDAEAKSQNSGKTASNSLPSKTGNYYLTNDVTLNSTWIPVDGTVLCLNGHSITADGDVKAIYVIDITFTLCDCKGDDGAYGKITHPVGKTGSGVYMTGANSKFNMYGGSITNNTADNGGGVYMAGGQFTMYGGEISRNTTTTGNGGGVYVGGGTFTMKGSATVKENTASGNTAYQGNGGGVYVYSGTFTMNDTASVSSNKATNSETTNTTYGGGVYVSGGTFNMNGKARITGNTAKNGGGVNVRGGKFNMSGGSITRNIGNGVCVSADATFTVSHAPTVTGNTMNKDDSNVYLNGGAYITIGGTLTGSPNSIGVTVGAGSVIANNVSADYSGKFFSDDSTYVVKYDNKQLVLAVPSAATHTHSWQFTKETGNDSTIFVSCKGTPGTCDYTTTPATVKISTDQTVYDCAQITEAPKATLTYSANWPKDVVKAQENDIKYWRSNDGGTSYKVPVTDNNELKKPGKYLAQLEFNGKWLEARFSVVDSSKQDPTYTAPTAKSGLVYNGENQPLINEGSTNDGRMWYRLSTDTVYSTLVPTGKDAGEYIVYYKVEGNDGYNDVAEQSIRVYIDKAKLSGTPGFTKVTAAGKTLKDVTLTKADGWPDGKFEWGNGVLGYLEDKPLVQGKAYSWLYLADNYYAEGTVVLWADPSSGGSSSGGSSSGGGGGSSSPSNHPVKAEVSKDPDGSVSLSKTSAAKGDKVTITVKPERHYEVDEVIVRDSKGKQLAVKDNGDGTFTFEMPADKVTVEPSFSWVNPFADVADSAYYVDAVEWMLKREVTQGTTETTFSPDLNCTRAQIVTFLWRVAGSPAPKGTVNFADVSADSYYAKAVAWATENGITDGIGGGLFSPDATCTRAQSAVFLYRVAGSPAVNGSAGFSDVAADAYYAQAVAWAKEHGITDGIGGGLFGSANDCTRAQIAAFLYRYMK